MAIEIAIEDDVHRLCAEGATAAATASAIRGYGPEILGFLLAQHRGEHDADDVFSIWCERVLRGLPGFGWGSSLRTWLYTVARNASINFARGKKARARHEQAPGSVEIAAVAQEIRSATPAHLRTAAKSKLAAIRDALPAEDRMLLLLRVDKRLEWKELARVMLGEDGDLTDAGLTKESQRLRKRFQLLKEKLVEAGKREGILGDDERS
jgi:RNA polymerase sigma-70 factor (ECF subfamily)